MTKPENLAGADAIAPGLTPVYPDAADLAPHVDTPLWDRLAIGDPRLIELLRAEIRKARKLTLLRSDRSTTDCRLVSLFSIHTVRQLGEELGTSLDKRCFRANIYLELKSGRGLDEDTVVGRTLRIGPEGLDPRCKMIKVDPDSASQQNAEVMKQLPSFHETKAGVYGASLIECTIRPLKERRR